MERFVTQRQYDLIAEYTEIESGKKTDRHRPQLAAAIEAARRNGATLMIAKLDRLARNAAFLLTLRDSGINFIAVDMPDANDLTVGILAVIAEHESKMVSERTKAALQARKARGELHGWAMPSRQHQQGLAMKRGHSAVRMAADEHARRITPIVDEIRAAGIATLIGTAKALNARGIETARGGKWYATTVRNVLMREAVA